MTSPESTQRKKCDKILGKICSKNYDNLSEPLDLMGIALEECGFDKRAMDGIYTGRDGRTHDQVGKKTWLTLTWHKFEDVPRYEVIAYVS